MPEADALRLQVIWWNIGVSHVLPVPEFRPEVKQAPCGTDDLKTQLPLPFECAQMIS